MTMVRDATKPASAPGAFLCNCSKGADGVQWEVSKTLKKCAPPCPVGKANSAEPPYECGCTTAEVAAGKTYYNATCTPAKCVAECKLPMQISDPKTCTCECPKPKFKGPADEKKYGPGLCEKDCSKKKNSEAHDTNPAWCKCKEGFTYVKGSGCEKDCTDAERKKGMVRARKDSGEYECKCPVGTELKGEQCVQVCTPGTGEVVLPDGKCGCAPPTPNWDLTCKKCYKNCGPVRLLRCGSHGESMGEGGGGVAEFPCT